MEIKREFNQYKFKSPLIREIYKHLNFEFPSEIQKKIIDQCINGINSKVETVVIKSSAGSGKTFGFMMMLLENFNCNDKNLQGIIIVPTRELALQMEEYFNIIKDKVRFKVLIGGKANIPGKVKKDKLDINNMPQIIIGTLGKIHSVFINKGKLWNDNIKNKEKNIYNSLNNIIIDEADKMITQNANDIYTKMVKVLINKIYSNKQNNQIIPQIILCSASFNENELLYYKTLLPIESNNIIIISSNIPNENEDKTNKCYQDNYNNNHHSNIVEFYHIIKQDKKITYYEQKYKILFTVLSKLQSKYNQCIIFYNQKGKGEELAMELRNYNFSICFIHGGLSQDQRQLIFEEIKKLKIKIIISTDLLNRGIDLTAVNLVINFDIPYSITDYCHRVGRTGRFYTEGIAFTLIQENEAKGEFYDSISQNAKFINEIDNNTVKVLNECFDSFKDNKRISNEDKVKVKQLINIKANDINEEEIEFLNKKRRLEQFNNESKVHEWESVKSENYINNGIQCNKKFCLYCDLLKVFDV